MISELLKVPEAYSHESMKQLIDDISQSSIMRLDPVSMDRLWDLTTMVFKWQVTLSHNVLAVTARHLYEIETFTTNPDTQLQLHRVQNVIDNFEKILSADEKVDLTQHILIWLHNFNIRVSLLLRLGFQNQDASFKLEQFDPQHTRMLENIGENIYAATKNLNLSRSQDIKQAQEAGKQELNAMINQILGEDNQNKNVHENPQFFKLSIGETYDDASSEPTQNTKIYSEIDVSNSRSALQNIFNISTSETDSVSNIHEDLLNIIDENC